MAQGDVKQITSLIGSVACRSFERFLVSNFFLLGQRHTGACGAAVSRVLRQRKLVGVVE